MSDQQTAAAATAPITSFDSLKPRAELKGKVTKVELAGAHVDIGTGTDALMHISEIKSDKPITRLSDVLKVGDEITVYVVKVDAAHKRINITMRKPPSYGWDNLETWLRLDNVKVVSVTKFGLFVNIDGPKDALLPHEFAPRDVRLKAGDIIEKVWVTEINEGKNRIGLTTNQPPDLPWEKIRKGNVLKGTVTNVDRGVVYVEVGAEREGQIRRNSLGVSFVDPGDLVTVGEEIEVRVVKVDSNKKILDLSLTNFNPEDYALSSGSEATITPIEAALKKAQRRAHADAGLPEAKPATYAKADKRQAAQAEAISRTLQHLQAQRQANEG